MVPISMTLIDPWPGFQGRDIFLAKSILEVKQHTAIVTIERQ